MLQRLAGTLFAVAALVLLTLALSFAGVIEPTITNSVAGLALLLAFFSGAAMASAETVAGS